MLPFNYHHLYYFYTIARLGSVTRASAELRIGQPALSTQVRRFEQFFNTRLFERQGRSLRLTDEGQYVYAYAKDIFDLGREFKDGFSDLGHRGGRVAMQIGLSQTVPKSFADSLLHFLLKTAPDLHLTVREAGTSTLIDQIKAHSLDLVLSDEPGPSDPSAAMDTHLVGEVPVVLCARADKARAYARIPKDLDGAPLILPIDSRTGRAVREYFIAQKVRPRIIAEVEDVELVRRLVLTGAGIAPLNLHTALHAPSRSKLAILGDRSVLGLSERTYVLTMRRKKRHPLVTRVLEDFRVVTSAGAARLKD